MSPKLLGYNPSHTVEAAKFIPNRVSRATLFGYVVR
jgi:hypothetical protein